MRRPLRLRALAALVAAWFTLYTVEPAPLHACAEHSPVTQTAAPDEHSEHAHGSHEQAPDEGKDASCCTCPSDCSPTAATASYVVAAFHADFVSRPASPGVSRQVPRAASARLLPFANGPPTSA